MKNSPFSEFLDKKLRIWKQWQCGIIGNDHAESSREIPELPKTNDKIIKVFAKVNVSLSVLIKNYKGFLKSFQISLIFKVNWQNMAASCLMFRFIEYF